MELDVYNEYLIKIYNEISAGHYSEAVKYIDVVYKSGNEDIIKNSNLYLVLLNSLMELPKEHKALVLKIENEFLNDEEKVKNYFDKSVKKEMISLLFKREFYDVLKNYGGNNFNDKDIDFSITKLLLERANNLKLKVRNRSIKLIENKKYEELIIYLEGKKNVLNYSDSIVLEIAKDIVKIRQDNVLPIKRETRGDNLFKLIYYKQYEKALKVSREYNKRVPYKKTPLNLILVDINEIISEVRVGNKTEDEIKNTIFDNLSKKDIESALNGIYDYLKVNNKLEYEFLINNLIKVSIVTKDYKFSLVMEALNSVNNEDYSFEINKYVNNFKALIDKNNTEGAKIYLDIINKYSRDEQLIRSLENKLSLSRISEVISSGNLDSDVKFVQRKVDYLSKYRGIVLLRPMDIDRRHKIKNIANSYPNVVAFSIGEGEKKRVVLRYTTNEKMIPNVNNLIEKGNSSYKKGNYEECIDTYLDILQGPRPKAVAYLKIGMSYLKLFKRNKAFQYLTVAQEVGKEEGKDFDLYQLLDSLRSKEFSEIPEHKPSVKIEEDIFNGNDDYYGVKDIDGVARFVSTGVLSIEEACDIFKVPSEKVPLVKLIFAREYYYLGHYEMGDKLYKMVLESKDKTSLTKKVLEEVRVNKNFYKNRGRDMRKALALPYKITKFK